MATRSRTILSMLFTTFAAVGILIQPTYALSKATHAPASKSQAQTAKPKTDGKPGKARPVPPPSSPMAVLSPDLGNAKTLGGCKIDRTQSAQTPAVETDVARSCVAVTPVIFDSFTGHLHRPAHFAQAPPQI